MTVECTQTTHQKETITLIKDFFDSADNNIFHTVKWGTNIMGRLFGATGIKFDKPFMAEVFEGSFTTSSLLKKYPINESQVMYIFPIQEQYGIYNDKKYYEVKATRVYHDGKVYTDRNNNLKWGKEKYFNHEQTDTYYTLNDYNTHRQQAVKTLVLVANKENVIELKNRKSISEEEYGLIQNIFNGYYGYKIHRVKLVKKEDNKYWVTLRNGRGTKCEYQNSNDFEPFDKSGYCVRSFRKSLVKRLGNYSHYLRLKRVVETDYSQELQTRYDEIIVLKNLIATSIINNTDLDTLKTLNDLMSETLSTVHSHKYIINRLKKSSENYEECKHEPLGYYSIDCYKEVDDVVKSFKILDQSIMNIRTKLFDEILQQDI